MEETSRAWNASFLRDKDSTQPVPGYHLVWEYLPGFRHDGYSFVQSMCVLWHVANPTVVICPWRGGDSFLLRWHRGAHGGQFPCISHWERPTGPEGPMPAMEADLVLFLLRVHKALFHPVLGCSVLFLQLRYQDAVG